MRRTLFLVLILSVIVIFSALTDELKWTGSADLVKVTRDNARTGAHSLLFDTTIDKNATSRMVSASIGGEMKGILEGWLLDDPVLQPVWITFGSDMRCCVGVQFGNQANYTLRVGGTDQVDTQVPRIEGWVGFRLEFTGDEVIYYISVDDGESWLEVGESKEFKTFSNVHLRNNENTGVSVMAAYFDDIRAMDSTGKTVFYDGFGGDADPLSVSSEHKLPFVWGRIRTAR